MNRSDETLMLAVRRGEERAFAELYDRYAVRMYRFFYRMLGRDRERARDFTQEIFVKIIEKPQLYDPARPFSTWFYAVAMNMCKNEYRRQGKQQTELFNPEKDLETDGFDPIGALDQPIFEQQLQRALDCLGGPHRRALTLRFQEERSIREISEIENCPEGTVKSRLHHALRHLAGLLESWKTMR